LQQYCFSITAGSHMALVDLAGVRGFDARPLSAYGSLMRAILANFRTGLSHGHIDESEARGYFSEVLARFEQLRRTNAGQLHVDRIYLIMCEVFEWYRDQNFFRRTPRPQVYQDQLGFSYQSHYAFPHWLADTVPETMLIDPEAAAMFRLCKAMEEPGNWREGATIGPTGDVLWLTPYIGEVRQMVDSARGQLWFEGLSPVAANRLREILGLCRRKPGEHAIAVITTTTLGDLLPRDKAGPYAPTIFEARSYERFRHWPPMGDDDSEHVGRTYDLSQGARHSSANGRHGVPEVVTLPLAVSEVDRVIYLGAIREVDNPLPQQVGGQSFPRGDTDREFAEEVSNGEPAATLLRWLSERLKL
jgi:hypothetical protein